MKLRHSGNLSDALGRSPYGERGLKYPTLRRRHHAHQSLSLRRAWIEIPATWIRHGRPASLSLRRAWIEIDLRLRSTPRQRGRSPYGERGLKSCGQNHHHQDAKSLSLRRAWIEMGTQSNESTANSSRSPYGERGLKLRTGQ